MTYFAHTLSHAFAAATLAFQGSETGEGGSSASATLLPQRPVLLGSSSVLGPGSEPALNFRMLLVDGVIFPCLQGAIALRASMTHH